MVKRNNHDFRLKYLLKLKLGFFQQVWEKAPGQNTEK